GPQSGFLEVVSDDERSPAVRVDLLAAAAPPRLLVAPDPLALGEVLVPCTHDAAVEVRNGGDVPVRVDGARLDQVTGAGLALEPAAVLPTTLAPGASVLVPVRWTPPATGPLGASLVITSDDTLPERRVTVGGTAVHAREVVQTFVAPGKPAVDVVFAVD